jgi:hypothetical protein
MHAEEAMHLAQQHSASTASRHYQIQTMLTAQEQADAFHRAMHGDMAAPAFSPPVMAGILLASHASYVLYATSTAYSYLPTIRPLPDHLLSPTPVRCSLHGYQRMIPQWYILFRESGPGLSGRERRSHGYWHGPRNGERLTQACSSHGRPALIPCAMTLLLSCVSRFSYCVVVLLCCMQPNLSVLSLSPLLVSPPCIYTVTHLSPSVLYRMNIKTLPLSMRHTSGVNDSQCHCCLSMLIVIVIVVVVIIVIVVL